MNPGYGRHGLTARQLQVLAAIMDGRRRGKVTRRSLARSVGLSGNPNSMHHCLEKLRSVGLVVWDDASANTIVPTCRFIPADKLEESHG